MNEFDFWYGDEFLLNVYVKAYFEKTKYESWLNGYYNYVAQVTALSNMFSDKKSKQINYPSFEISSADKIEKIESSKPRNNNDYEFLSQYY